MGDGGTTGTPIGSQTVIESLIPYIRVEIGDMSSPYRYENAWIIQAVKAATLSLKRYLYNKYLIDDSTEDIVRNDLFNNYFYTESEVGVIEPQDKSLFILLASIIISRGDLENNAWNVGSWKDYEISYSNIQAGKVKDGNLARLYKEFEALITPPTKRLAGTLKGHLPGYIENIYETK